MLIIDSAKFYGDLMMKESITLDFQRYAELLMGSSSYAQLANGMGLPVSAFFNLPVLLSFKGSISKPKTPTASTGALIVGRHIDLNL